MNYRLILLVAGVFILFVLIAVLPHSSEVTGKIVGELVLSGNKAGVHVVVAVDTSGYYLVRAKSSIDTESVKLYMEKLRRYELFIPIKALPSDRIKLELVRMDTRMVISRYTIMSEFSTIVGYNRLVVAPANNTYYYVAYHEDGVGVIYYLTVKTPTYTYLVVDSFIGSTSVVVKPLSGKKYVPEKLLEYSPLIPDKHVMYVAVDVFPKNKLDIILNSVKRGDSLVLVMPRFIYKLVDENGVTYENPNAEKLLSSNAVIYYYMDIRRTTVTHGVVVKPYKYYRVEIEGLNVEKLFNGLVWKIRYGSGYIYWIPSTVELLSDTKLILLKIYIDYIESLGVKHSIETIKTSNYKQEVVVASPSTRYASFYSFIMIFPATGDKNIISYRDIIVIDTPMITIKTG